MKKKQSADLYYSLLKAISFAARKHEGQYRKDGVTPYASHPFRVAITLRHVFGIEDEEMLTAAVLHDVIEDTTADYDEVGEEFSPRVAHWVSLLSKDKRLPHDIREKIYKETLLKAPLEVQWIKLADLHDNLLDACHGVGGNREKTLAKVRDLLKQLKTKHVPALKPGLHILENLVKRFS